MQLSLKIMQLSRFVTATKTCPSNDQRITWTVFRWKWVKLIRSLLDQSLSYWTAEASIPSHAIGWQGQLITAWLNVRVQAEPILANSYTGWRRSWVIFVGGPVTGSLVDSAELESVLQETCRHAFTVEITAFRQKLWWHLSVRHSWGAAALSCWCVVFGLILMNIRLKFNVCANCLIGRRKFLELSKCHQGVEIGKARAASAQSFTPWQQATIDITRHDHHSIIACSRHVYVAVA